jgi:hypothetical protein
MYRRAAPIFEDGQPVPPPLTPEGREAWVSGIMNERI